MSEVVIKVENLSKRYQLGTIGTGTLFRDLNVWWALKTGQPHPYAKVDGSGNFTDKSEHWALNNLSFEIKAGKAVGIIGKNGAGKSTILKILSRVTSPTSGNIKIKGQVASLLEVGTGFHPEMTGRENMFLNGAILGMSKAQIGKKMDEIVDFAGIEKYIDTPVKRYSSGMYVRLAFGVAAHLEPDILIVDEVLAVGDAEFQKKCMGKMNDVSKKEGRTVLFVSHNMQAVRSLCDVGMVLNAGSVDFIGDSYEAVNRYLSHKVNELSVVDNSALHEIINNLPNDRDLKYNSIKFYQQGNEITNIQNEYSLEVHIEYEIFNVLTGFRMFLDFYDKDENLIFKSFFDEQNDWGSTITIGKYRTIATIPANIFVDGNYFLVIRSGIHAVRMINPENGIQIPIRIEETGKIYRKRFNENDRGYLTPPVIWTNTLIH